MKKLTILTFIAILIFNLTACGKSDNQPVSSTNFYFDTSVTITIYDWDSDAEPESVIKECFAMCNHYDKLFSRTYTDSDVSKINNSNGKSIEVNSVVSEVIEDGIKYGNLTDGAFDITIAPLSSLWNIGNQNADIPSETDIEEALPWINYRNITVDNDNIKLKLPNAKIDLGGIAKGFIADKLKSYMTSKGITSAIIDLGGNILTIGGKTSEEDFTIGVKKPFSENAGEYAATIKVNGKSVVTSGVYERYFEKDGKIYHHILDPKTGYPVDNTLNSVTIISDKSEDGDALSTGVFVMGLDQGLELINSLENTDAIFITKENKIIVSNGLEINDKNQISIKK